MYFVNYLLTSIYIGKYILSYVVRVVKSKSELTGSSISLMPPSTQYLVNEPPLL